MNYISRELKKIIIKKNCKNLIIITGQQRSGKSLITNLIGTFRGPLNVKINFYLDNIIQLLKNKLVSKDQFKYLFLIFIDNLIIDNTLGRNLNYKKDEESSIWNTSNPNFYLKRTKQKITKRNLKRLLTKENELVIVLHNFIEFKNILNNCHINTKIVYIEQDPIDHIYSLYKSKINKLPSALDRSLIFKNKKNIIMNDLNYLKKNLGKKSEIGKILIDKYLSDVIDKKMLKSSTKNVKVIKINYKNLIINPKIQLKKLLSFLNKKKTIKTNSFFLSNEQKKRLKFFDKKNRVNRKKFILSKIKSKKDLQLFKKILRN